jgi:hypothetical protein
MTDPSGQTELTRLREVLETYGADRSRWPATERLSLAPFIAASEAARRLIAEFQTLDRLVAQATPRAEVAALSLTERIVAAAERERNQANIEVAKTSTLTHRRPPQRKLQYALLAACVAFVFMAGLFAGLSGWLDPAFLEVADVGMSQDIDDPLFDEELI